MIYLDNNATTPLDREVADAMLQALPLFGNPSSSHSHGTAAKAVIEVARCKVAGLVGATPSEMIFTSGGTEADNLAIIGTAYRHEKGHIITTSIEHPAVLNPVKWLSSKGFGVTLLPVGPDGRVDPGEVKRAVRKDTILITVMHSNNETGALQPIAEIGSVAKELGIPFHTDAAQSVGKMDVNVQDLNVDMLTVVPHKFYGPKGCGALYIRNGIELKPILFGAGHERGLRPGTENIIGISGLGKACEIAARDLPHRYSHAKKLRDMLFDLLKNSLDIKLNGHPDLRLPNTLNISIKGIIAEDLVAALKNEVAFSAGSACHAGVRKPSAVLKAMGLSDEDALSSVRLSVGKDNNEDEIKGAAEKITASVKTKA
ncbi:MAG: cysteine desulfurase [Nitrospirae bacterium]|nr:MAG: cysteine desulfurase [Nitrospirota bacterium]